MTKWKLSLGDLKNYPHFDPPLSIIAAKALVTDPLRVAQHKFYPFIRFHQRWNKFNIKGSKGKKKERPIRYAARADAYIFTYYRHMISVCYERELSRLGLSGNVLAYRRIPTESGQGGKCNIHHVRDAVLAIRGYRNCFVIALDISSFFESLDHSRIKILWCRMLGVERLPPDHLKVFQAITAYAIVDKESAYERLGFFGVKRIMPSGQEIKGYLRPVKALPRQLCFGKEFRQKIAGGDGRKSIIKKHMENYGIPQGAPLSDLIANMYLIDFDAEIKNLIQERHGSYMRYSDDILIIVPSDESSARALAADVRNRIGGYGRKMKIKEEKSSIFEFRGCDADQHCRVLDVENGKKGRNGLEYLGFRYDGKKIYLRDSTLSNLWRKVTRAARRQAHATIKRHPGEKLESLKALLSYERFVQNFGRVDDFNEMSEDYRNWTFWTYARKAAELLGPIGSPIMRQLASHRKLIRLRLDAALEDILSRRR